MLYDVNDNPVALGPVNYSQQPYVAYQDSAWSRPDRVAIVYSGTSAKLYFSPTAYSDLFMAAQNQARMAGVSYDVIDESQLTNINNLVGYDALIFPSMADVNSAQLPAIMSTLTSAVYNYHIGIITSGDFLTNDQTGAALAGNSYANMQTLLGLTRSTGGSGDVTVTANDVSNPIMDGYTTGQVIQIYVGEGYNAYKGYSTGRRARQPERWRRRTCQALLKPPPAGPTFISPARLCSATAICCRMPSRASCSVAKPASRCTRPVKRASWRRAWTWTSRNSPRTCRRLAEEAASMTS